MLSPQWLDELRARVTLSGVIGRTTRIQKAGREWKACCPFHNEKTPSFTINDEKGFYHCFGCGAHGDVIRWMTDQRGPAFMDAIKELASEAGMEVPAPDPRAARAAEKRDTLHDVMQAAQDWFVGNLHAPAGQVARDYLQRRGISPLTAERFGFGYAPEDRQAMKTALSRFPEEMLIEAGLRIAVDGKEPYDRFRGRLMLPIRDARGRVIAFGGRILEDREGAPKYLNSPDTPLFDKGRTLYNLNNAAPAARQTGRLIVVEGYMDVVALAAAGIEECVAPMGTALTEQQIQLLWRQVESPVLCFDGDAAGQRAAMRAIGRALPLLRPAHSLRIVTLPQGLDPDDLVKRDGARAMEALLQSAKDLHTFVWESEKDAQPINGPNEIEGLHERLKQRWTAISHDGLQGEFRRLLETQFKQFRRILQDSWYQRQKSRKPAQWLSDSQTRANAPVLNRRVQFGGARDGLSAAVLAGFVRWPGEIARHADTLARTGGLDPRFGLLLDCCDAAGMVESADLPTILAENGIVPPEPREYAGLRFGFLGENASREEASAELSQAVGILVERPALEQALAEATARFERDLSDEAYAEQQRLLKRKLEFERRLVQMAGGRAAAEQAS